MMEELAGMATMTTNDGDNDVKVRREMCAVFWTTVNKSTDLD
jgi:hypothetical protein